MIESGSGGPRSLTARLSGSEPVEFEVADVPTLREAMRCAARHAFDVAILDLNLTDSQGVGGIWALKGARPSLPLIVVSDVADESLRQTALEMGADELLCRDELAGRLLTVCVLRATERRQAREQQSRLARLYTVMPDAILVAGRDGSVEYVNERAVDFLGTSREQLIGNPLFFAVPESGTGEIRVPAPSGERVGEMQVVRGDTGGVARVICIRDVTEQRSLETRMKLLEQMASLGAIAASVAHEINNPLGAILTNLELALLDRDGRSIVELQDARSATLRVRQIVRDLKVLSHAGEETCLLDPNEVMKSAIRMTGPEVRHRARIVTDFGVVGMVRANETRLIQVFLNLLVNAAQAIPESNAAANEIRVTTLLDDEDGLVVHVEGTGCGIAPEVQARLFTPFFTTKKAGAGTGLGLAICRRIVTSMGGTLSFESQLGRGSRFTVRLRTDSRRAPVRASPVRMAPAPVARGSVLVIDADPLIVDPISRRGSC